MSQTEETELIQDCVIVSKRIKKEKSERINKFVEEYFAPAIKQFPELEGRKIQVWLRKHGWFADYDPNLQITIREESLSFAECRIKSTTAHELMHLAQFVNEIGKDNTNSIQDERQATFLTFSRGFAYDFLKSFSVACDRDSCDHKFKCLYFCCDKIFKDCCKKYSEDELLALAEKLRDLSSNYSLWDNPDYNKIVLQCCIGE